MRMNREEMVRNLYHYRDSYSLNNPLYRTTVIAFMNEMLGEDLSEPGCITARAIFSESDEGVAMISSKEEGILAGLKEVCLLMDNYKDRLTYTLAKKNGRLIEDGDALHSNEDPILFLKGNVITILEIERTVLNILQRMGGIATEVRKLQEIIKNCGSRSRLAATRKLQWGRLDKKAFITGGGLSHRRGLYDTMMIKDTEIDFLKFVEMTTQAQTPEQRRQDWVIHCIEKCWLDREQSMGLIVEVQTQDEALAVAAYLVSLQGEGYYPCSIMLDNFSPDEISATLEASMQEGTHDSVLFESSGNIHAERIVEYAKTNVDVISVGRPTHSTDVLDIHMVIQR
jgi:nicotinate-nucleotide pyrophosphorylase (carboxylating)